MREPTKAIYDEFEADGSLEFDHYLAERLGWRSVEEMRQGMSMVEWKRWWIYFARKAQRQELAALEQQSRG